MLTREKKKLLIETSVPIATVFLSQKKIVCKSKVIKYTTLSAYPYEKRLKKRNFFL